MTWSLSGGSAPPTSIGLDALDRAIRYFHYAEAMLRRTLAGLEPTRSAEDGLAVAKQIVKTLRPFQGLRPFVPPPREGSEWPLRPITSDLLGKVRALRLTKG
jgi:hypothetical protein